MNFNQVGEKRYRKEKSPKVTICHHRAEHVTLDKGFYPLEFSSTVF